MQVEGAGRMVWVMCVLWMSYLTLPLAVQGLDYYSESSMREPVAAGAKYDNHLNTSQALHNPDFGGWFDSSEMIPEYHVETGPEATFNPHQFGCQACQYRNVFAMASLKSIQKHVLMKLGMKHLPNRTDYPEVPQQILNHFYGTQSQPAPDPDYPSDDPSSMGAEQPEETDETYDYYQITNKIYILPNRKQTHR